MTDALPVLGNAQCQVERLLGSGAFAHVYLARISDSDNERRTNVALKVCHSCDSKDESLFEREARILQALTGAHWWVPSL